MPEQIIIRKKINILRLAAVTVILLLLPVLFYVVLLFYNFLTRLAVIDKYTAAGNYQTAEDNVFNVLRTYGDRRIAFEKLLDIYIARALVTENLYYRLAAIQKISYYFNYYRFIKKDYYFWAGKICYRLGIVYYSQADEFLQKFIKNRVDPQMLYEAIYTLVLVQHKLGKYLSAFSLLEQAAGLSPENKRKLDLLRGRMLYEQGQKLAAREVLEKIVLSAYDSVSAEGAFLLADISLEFGMSEQAEFYYKYVLEHDPVNVQAMKLYGLLLQHNNNRREARNWWNKALSISAEDQEIKKYLKKYR
ncbi:MAG: hypothetical protein A2096_15160 [Spirochaetes bacterium GWF1_41_5]|nr:MAG: hypothetical protein A2096_15160 [Spirochaetes bacterium GWF1_41_5]